MPETATKACPNCARLRAQKNRLVKELNEAWNRERDEELQRIADEERRDWLDDEYV